MRSTDFKLTSYKSSDITFEKAWKHLSELFQDKAENGGQALRLPGFGKIDIENGSTPFSGAQIRTVQERGLAVSGKIIKIGPGSSMPDKQGQLILEFDTASYGGYPVGENRSFKIIYDLGFTTDPILKTSLWALIEVKSRLTDRKPAKHGDKDNGFLIGPQFKAEHAMREIEESFFPQLVNRNS